MAVQLAFSMLHILIQQKTATLVAQIGNGVAVGFDIGNQSIRHFTMAASKHTLCSSLQSSHVIIEDDMNTPFKHYGCYASFTTL